MRVQAATQQSRHVGRRGNRRWVPRVRVGAAPEVRLSGETGVCTARLADLSPWGIGLHDVPRPAPPVGSRVQVAFGFGNWSISRAAEVRRHDADTLGLALADPLPHGLRCQLLDLQMPRMTPAEDGEPRSPTSPAGPPPGAGGSADHPLTRHRLWISESGETVGRVAVSRWSNTTWLAHGMSAQTLHPQAPWCWRDLYRFAATAPVYGDGDRAHLLVFHDVDGPWHPRFTTDFAAWLDDPTSAMSMPLHRVTALSEAFGPPPAACPARAEDLIAFVEHTSDTLPPLVNRALGWDIDGLRAPFGHPELDAQVSRTRAIFRLGSDLDGGFAVLERSQDTARPAPVDGSDPEALLWIVPGSATPDQGILNAVRAVLAAGDISRATVVCTQALAGVPSEPIGLLVASADGLRQYDDYLGAMFDDGGARQWWPRG